MRQRIGRGIVALGERNQLLPVSLLRRLRVRFGRCSPFRSPSPDVHLLHIAHGAVNSRWRLSLGRVASGVDERLVQGRFFSSLTIHWFLLDQYCKVELGLGLTQLCFEILNRFSANHCVFLTVPRYFLHQYFVNVEHGLGLLQL